MNWIGLIFLTSLWFGGPPLLFNPGEAPLYGLNEEHFFTESECWDYFDNHPSFKQIRRFSFNHYDKEYKIKLYKIDRVGVAWVTCKRKNEPRTMPNFNPR